MAVKTKKINWNELYVNLPENIAKALRDARLKPEQIKQMADGEVLGIEGITSKALEEIRAHYPAEIDLAPEDTPTEPSQEEKEKPKTPNPKTRYPRSMHGRSSTYQHKKSKIKKDQYPLNKALKLLREVSYSKHKTVELHLNTTDTGIRGEVTLPFTSGKKLNVSIFTPALATKIKAGKINFDLLLATPADMPQIAPLAKVLGPKGLMPNPKSGTIIDNPKERKAILEKGAQLTYRTEAKSPLIHLSLGNLDQKDTQLSQNITTAIDSIGINKIKSAYIKSTMSPSIQLSLGDFK